jgi:hypothetical protein
VFSFKIRITRKKITVNGQCTYSDLDCLIQDFSLEKILKCLDFLFKVTFVCSSTLVYLFVSSLFVSSCMFSLRIQIFNQINMITKFNSLLNTSSSTNLTRVSNEALNQNQIISNLNEFSRTQENLDYLLDIDQIQKENVKILDNNKNVYNFSAQKCLLNEKLIETRMDLKDFFGFNSNDLKHRYRHVRSNYHLGELKPIQFVNVYHRNFF